MTTEEVFEELRTIVEKIDHCFSVYKHTDPDGLFYIGFCRNDPKQRWDYGGFSGERKRGCSEMKKSLQPLNSRQGT